MTDIPLLNNRYQLIHTLGTGGTAVVYRARDLKLERPVAIKILKNDFFLDETFRERFHQEAKAAANLSHPNIVTVHDFGLENDQLFIVMEYIPGTDLKTLLRQRGRFSLDEALNLIIQACAGIGYAHRCGLVHCDVKPHNLLVTPDYRVKVTDFGIARALNSIQPDEKSEIVWGSPQYFSPEQACGSAPSPASDVYSLGVILFELLTGSLPFNAESPEDLAHLHRDAPPPSIRQFNPDIPLTLEQTLLKVLSKEPSARYRTADQLGRVLSAIQQAEQQNGALDFTLPASVPPAANTIKTTISETKPVVPVEEPRHPFDIDWKTISLGLLATLAVGGLIPFWLFVWYSLNPPVP